MPTQIHPSALQAAPLAVPAHAQLPWLTADLLAWVVLGLLLLVAVLAWQLGQQRRRGQRQRAALREQLVEDGSGQPAGLVSRARFDEALITACVACDSGRAQRAVAVLFIDFDNFRAVNDTQGFENGNRVIEQAAARLMALFGGRVTASRLGGDEGVLLVPTDRDGACALAARLCRVLAQPYAVRGRDDLQLTCSIGVALYPEHGAAPRLVGHAAAALREVKRAGGGDYMVFEPRMAVDQRDQSQLLADLRHAVVRGELELYYQPKVDARSLQITAAEALLRWHHPQRGMISPTLFIPLAERHGLIGPIGNWVIDDACRQAALWRDRGLHMRVAINVSAYQMRQDDLVDRIQAALVHHRLKPGRFTCEITESVAMEDTQVTQRSFERLRQAGVHVSIDDFGVGQASLSYLRRLPARELKIDASFVQDVAASSQARAIVDAVVKLAHALSLRVVAEGVETQAQCDILVQLGCDELQGYLFARPMTANALITWALMDDDRSRPGASAGARAGAGSFRDSLFDETVPQSLGTH